MCQNTVWPLTFEALLSDPLTRLVMDADGVTLDEFIKVMEAARDAVVARERAAIMPVFAVRLATSARA